MGDKVVCKEDKVIVISGAVSYTSHVLKIFDINISHCLIVAWHRLKPITPVR